MYKTYTLSDYMTSNKYKNQNKCFSCIQKLSLSNTCLSILSNINQNYLKQ